MHQKIFAGKTDIGCKRSNNEDQYITSPEYHFCAASDGMGGAAAGEIASSIFIDTASDIFSDSFSRTENEVIFRVKKVFSLANEKILEHVKGNPHHEGMGCTAELLAFYDSGFVLGHVGDSRAYLLRKDQFRQITQDHTLVQQQVEAGIISSENVKTHPLRNIIIRAIGQNKELSIDLLRGNVFPEDIFLLCSDGLTDMISDDQIKDVLASDIDINEKVTELVERSKTAGGDDNITAVLTLVK